MTARNKKSAGRPIDPQITEQILNIAEALFFRYGLAGTSMEKIAHNAGIAKTTLYSRFSSKNELLDAVISRLAIPLNQLIVIKEKGKTVEDVLNEYGNTLVQTIADRRVRNSQSFMMAHAEQFPEISQRFFKAGPRKVRKQLANLLNQWLANGHLKRLDKTDTPETLAEELIINWQGFLIIEARMKHIKTLSNSRIKAQVKRATRNFLKLYLNN